MRKILVLLAVCAMAGSAVAGDITFSVTDNGSGSFTISYAATDPAQVPVGMGIKVSLTDATIGSAAAATAVDSFFDVFLDYASEDPCNYTIGDGNPLADPCAAVSPSTVLAFLSSASAWVPLTPATPLLRTWMS